MPSSFITADKAVGSGGFKASWTEIKDPSANCDLFKENFKCTANGYCIAPTLKCNSIHNCGKYDDSDEANCTYRCIYSMHTAPVCHFAQAHKIYREPELSAVLD